MTKDGTLSFKPVKNASGIATIAVRLFDTGKSAEDNSSASEEARFTIEITSSAEEFGQYHGLVTAAESAIRAHDKAGYLTLKVTATGSFSARLSLGSLDFPLTGSVGNDGVLRTIGTRTTRGRSEFTLPRAGLPALTLSMEIDVRSGTGRLSGLICENGLPYSLISADRLTFTAAKQLAPFQQHAPSEVLGKYTILLDPPASGITPDGAPIPHASGYAIVNILAQGSSLIAGKLPDGTSFSGAWPLTQEHTIPVFFRCYQRAGSISGKLHFRETPLVSDASGEWLWFRPAKSGPALSAYYSEGWPLGMELDAIASRYTPPVVGKTLFGTDGPLTASSSGNAIATVLDPSLSSSGIEIPLNLVKNSGRASTNPTDLTISVQGTIGLITGRFFHPVLKKNVLFQGVLFQKQECGAGLFQGPEGTGNILLHLNESR